MSSFTSAASWYILFGFLLKMWSICPSCEQHLGLGPVQQRQTLDITATPLTSFHPCRKRSLEIFSYIHSTITVTVLIFMVNSCLWHMYSQCNVWHRLLLHTHIHRSRSKLYFTHTGTIKDPSTVFERLLLSLRTEIQNKKTCYCFYIWLKFYRLPHSGLGRRSVPPATNKTPVTYTIACHPKLPQLFKCVCMCECVCVCVPGFSGSCWQTDEFLAVTETMSNRLAICSTLLLPLDQEPPAWRTKNANTHTPSAPIHTIHFHFHFHFMSITWT